MELDRAVEAIALTDGEELSDRAARLQELSNLLGDENITLFGQTAEWLFEDVKATWIYGYFVSTVVTAHAFCVQRTSGRHAETLGVVDLDMRARLVRLHDAAAPYLAANPPTVNRELERRVDDATRFSNEHALLSDARSALECCIGLLHP